MSTNITITEFDRKSAGALTGRFVGRFRELHALRDDLGDQLKAAVDEQRPHHNGEVVVLARAWSAVSDQLAEMEIPARQAIAALAKLEAVRKSEMETRGETWQPRRLEWPKATPLRPSYHSCWLDGEGGVVRGPKDKNPREHPSEFSTIERVDSSTLL